MVLPAPPERPVIMTRGICIRVKEERTGLSGRAPLGQVIIEIRAALQESAGKFLPPDAEKGGEGNPAI
jgi:hypothetical protein